VRRSCAAPRRRGANTKRTTSGTLILDGVALVDLIAGANLDVDVTGSVGILATTTFSIDGTGVSNVTATSGNLLRNDMPRILDGTWFRFDRHTNRLLVTTAEQVEGGMGGMGGMLHLTKIQGTGLQNITRLTTLGELFDLVTNSEAKDA